MAVGFMNTSSLSTIAKTILQTHNAMRLNSHIAISGNFSVKVSCFIIFFCLRKPDTFQKIHYFMIYVYFTSYIKCGDMFVFAVFFKIFVLYILPVFTAFGFQKCRE